ncbi:MAG TPA: SOS response-associated peptidase family protein [Rhizomicrobium sp.]|nr:SOS response-associated peptidase family protein [Rhizomicrobium sp.]
MICVMCGKFTAKASWTEVVDFIWSAPPADGEDDRALTYRVMNDLPLIVWEGEERRVMPMRWGFPHPDKWQAPQPIHARAETIDTTKAFAQAFRGGQRGIVLMKNFNEAPDINGPTLQHIITPGDEPMLAAASPAEVKACLKTTEGARWTMAKEERARGARRSKPMVSDPTGLF